MISFRVSRKDNFGATKWRRNWLYFLERWIKWILFQSILAEPTWSDELEASIKCFGSVDWVRPCPQRSSSEQRRMLKVNSISWNIANLHRSTVPEDAVLNGSQTFSFHSRRFRDSWSNEQVICRKAADSVVSQSLINPLLTMTKLINAPLGWWEQWEWGFCGFDQRTFGINNMESSKWRIKWTRRVMMGEYDGWKWR